MYRNFVLHSLFFVSALPDLYVAVRTYECPEIPADSHWGGRILQRHLAMDYAWGQRSMRRPAVRGAPFGSNTLLPGIADNLVIAIYGLAKGCSSPLPHHFHHFRGRRVQVSTMHHGPPFAE